MKYINIKDSELYLPKKMLNALYILTLVFSFYVPIIQYHQNLYSGSLSEKKAEAVETISKPTPGVAEERLQSDKGEQDNVLSAKDKNNGDSKKDSKEGSKGNTVSNDSEAPTQSLPARSISSRESSVVSGEDPIWSFVKNYPGGRINEDYYSLLSKYCGVGSHNLKLVIGMSVSESGMGGKGLASTKRSNFWNFFKGGNRAYDPDRDTMAREICNSVKTNYWLVDTDFHQARCYVRGCNDACVSAQCKNEIKSWQGNLNFSLEGMR